MNMKALKYEQIKRRGNLFRANNGEDMHYIPSQSAQLGYWYHEFINEGGELV